MMLTLLRTGRMITKIFHPNVSNAGEICVNTLKKDWKPEFGIAHILTTVKCLLIFPNPESALDEEAGKLLLEDYEEYCARARIVTAVHAKSRPVEFDEVSSAEETSTPAPAASSSASGPSTTAPAPLATLPPSISLTAVPPPPPTHSPRIPSSHLHGGSAENEPSVGTILPLKSIVKEARHPSPAPLGRGGNVGLGTDSSLANASANTLPSTTADPVAKVVKMVKTTKRSAVSPPVVTNAEKRKKALKRL
jgi:ubiquitin-conjugating enzyme E2 S